MIDIMAIFKLFKTGSMKWDESNGNNFFQAMFLPLIEYMRNDGITFIIVFPNDIAYPRHINSKLVHDFGLLTIYALPYRIGGIKPQLKILNWLSIFLSRSLVFLTSLFAGNKIYYFPIEKEMVSYNPTRYSQPDGGYYIEKGEGNGFVYKIIIYDGVRAAFLIDVFEKSARNFNAAVKHVIKHYHTEFDMLLYVGRLPFKLHGLIMVPQRFAPKKFHFIGKILNENEIETDLFNNFDNWDINLSNYDLI